MPTTCDRVVNFAASSTSPQYFLPSTVPASFLRLDNGLTLIHQEMPSVSVVSVDIWVKAGANCDPVGFAGMAHFLEHMIFRGTEAIAAGEFDMVIESEGGDSQAATSHDYAHYALTVATEQVTHTLPLLVEMLLNAKIDPRHLEQERLVVLEEIRRESDDPDWLAYQHLMHTAYGEHHPYGRSILGSIDTVEQITAEQMLEFHRSRYQPQCMTVAIAGAISGEQALDLVNWAFSAADSPMTQGKQPTCIQEVSYTQPKSAPTIQRQTISLPQVQHSRLNLAWMGASVQNLQEAIQLELLLTILVEGRSARLVQQLQEERGWIHDIAGSFSIQEYASLFNISAYLEASDLERVEHHIRQEIISLNTQLVSMNELNRAKRSLCNSFIFALESPPQLANFLGYYGLLGCQDLCQNWSSAYCEIISQTQPLDLQHLAQKYLTPDNYVVTRLIPEYGKSK
ncbi:MAG: pitrilysin family protein [Pseudanabaenaceae cyanobacterium bins.39]|nr:pitrilysin family protein [Pseudanabaenaceae cyanobacterium bins.39]